MKAAPDSIALEVQDWCKRLITNKIYRGKLELSFIERNLPNSMEQMVWNYAIGKAPEKVEHTFTDESDLHSATKDDLVKRLEALAKEAMELEEVPLNEGDSSEQEPNKDESIH